MENFGDESVQAIMDFVGELIQCDEIYEMSDGLRIKAYGRVFCNIRGVSNDNGSMGVDFPLNLSVAKQLQTWRFRIDATHRHGNAWVCGRFRTMESIQEMLKIAAVHFKRELEGVTIAMTD